MKIHLFGQLELVGNVRVSPRFPTRKSRELFAYLALNGRRLHSREALAGTFWPESSPTASRKCLRTELWRLRRLFEREGLGDGLLTVESDRVGLDPHSGVWIDVAAFEECLRPFGGVEGAPTPEASMRLREAVALYRGELLEGHYEDWCLEARERFHGLFVFALEQLMYFHQRRREWSAALYYGREILRQDSLAEHVHRDLMRCHFEMGNRTAALRQYSRCADLLMAELDVEPMHETSSLYQQIKTC